MGTHLGESLVWKSSLLSSNTPLTLFQKSLAVVVILIAFFVPESSAGRKCFSCTTATNEDCLRIDRNESAFYDKRMMVPCKDFCTIIRQEYIDDRGGVAWLNRSCEPEFMDSATADGYFIFYLRSCKQNLCNYGDGFNSFGEIIEDLDYDPEVANFSMEITNSNPKNFPVSIKYFLPFYFHLLMKYFL